MNRRHFGKIGFATMMAAVGATTIACDKKSLKILASTVVTFLEQALVEFKVLLPSSIGTITKALAVAKDLQSALASDSPNTIDLITQLMAPDGLINKVIDDVGLIPAPEKRKFVSGIIIISNIALRTIATALAQGAGPAVVATAKSRGLKGVSIVEQIADSKKLIGTLKALRTQE